MFILLWIASKISLITFNCGLKLSRVRLRFACNRRYPLEPRKSSVEAISRDFGPMQLRISIQLQFVFGYSLHHECSFGKNIYYFSLFFLNHTYSILLFTILFYSILPSQSQWGRYFNRCWEEFNTSCRNTTFWLLIFYGSIVTPADWPTRLMR